MVLNQVLDIIDSTIKRIDNGCADCERCTDDGK